jgi:hypothetical protein
VFHLSSIEPLKQESSYVSPYYYFSFTRTLGSSPACGLPFDLIWRLQMEELLELVAQFMESGTWQTYLRVQAQFHRYSFRNGLLIASQMPDASWVAGYRSWQRLGRQVRKGERSIRIVAPVLKDDSVVGFRSVPVFDISQTEGEPLPEPTKLLEGEAPQNQIKALANLAKEAGFDVIYGQLPRGVNGMCDHGEHRITIDRRLSDAHRLKTLAHELVHAIRHAPGEISREKAELEAESVAYMLLKKMGVDSSGFSFGYLADWSRSCGGLEALASCGERITATYRGIVERLWIG